MNDVKKVLIMAYFFPPRVGVGSIRPWGLAKYLPEFGWEPIVLTAKLPGSPPSGCKVIESDYVDVIGAIKKAVGFHPAKGVHEQLGVVPVKEGEKEKFTTGIISKIRSTLSFPDDQIGWLPYALKRGTEIIQTEGINTIISTSFPVTAHIVAWRLAKRFGIPWVADLRDLWTQNHYYRHGRIRFLLERTMECFLLSRASALVTVSSVLSDELRKLHVGVPVYSITNGFNPEEFSRVAVINCDKFTITYTGQLYRGKRDPEPLFQAVAELKDSGEIDINNFEIQFYGWFEPWLHESVNKYNLGQMVSVHSPVSRNEAISLQKNSTVLLLITWDHPQEQGVYTGKLFEYLGAKRPILAIGGPGG